MTIEDHLRRMVGDMVLTMAKLSAELDRVNEELAAAKAPALPPLPKPPDNDRGVSP